MCGRAVPVSPSYIRLLATQITLWGPGRAGAESQEEPLESKRPLTHIFAVGNVMFCLFFDDYFSSTRFSVLRMSCLKSVAQS